MKNILVLSPTPSHPQDAGNRKRIYSLTKYLQELGATIYFVYCPREWDREIPKNAYDGMNQCWDYFFVAYPVQRSVHQTDDEYFDIDAWWDVGIEYTINWIKLASNIDMVLCNYVFYSKVLELFDQSVTKVIDTHDIVSNRNYLLDRKLGYRDFFYVSPESEKKALDRANLVLSIKEDESSWFKCLSNTPVLTIGHLEPQITKIENREIDYENIRLGFIGSANPINVRNLESFLDEYFSIYGDCNDQFTFIVGGKVCSVLDGRFHDKVQVLGMVNNVSEFYEQVDIIVLPFEFSTGLKIKTVEALSWSKPCIGTVNAFEGLGSNCKYHSFNNIKALAQGIEDFIHDSQSAITQLEQDSKLVYTSYSNKVKESIKKLYQADWKSIKELQPDSNIALEIEVKSEIQQIYNFNLVTNVDFWNYSSNDALWINFWINNVRKLGNVNVYRTESFTNIETDKLKLFKIGLVNNVHHRELYQIFDLFKISPDENQIFINLLDFSSIIYNRSCLEELKQVKLSTNHFLWYFLCQSKIDNNNSLKEYAQEMLNKDFSNSKTCCLWDLNGDVISEESYNNLNILLPNNPINIRTGEINPKTLKKIVIGTSCLDENNLTELNKLVLCFRDFLPSHFELVIFSNSKLINSEYSNVYPLENIESKFKMLDIFICIEEPKSISLLIYLCICQSILINYKDNNFINDLPENTLIQTIDNFSSIPEAYKYFLEKSILEQEVNSNLTQHKSWNIFIKYWLTQLQNLSCLNQKNYSQIN